MNVWPVLTDDFGARNGGYVGGFRCDADDVSMSSSVVTVLRSDKADLNLSKTAVALAFTFSGEPTYDASMEQHELVTTVLCEAGGIRAEDLLPPGYGGRRADVIFRDNLLIAEVKSFTSNRRKDPVVASKLGEVLERGTAFGAPILFGTRTIGLHDLPLTVAERALRVVGARVRKEVSAAREQIAATRLVLAMPNAFGLLVCVTPPEQIGIQSIAWLINDALRDREDRNVLDGALIIETPVCAPAGAGCGDTFSCYWSISGRVLPTGMNARIAEAWSRITRAASNEVPREWFTTMGASE